MTFKKNEVGASHKFDMWISRAGIEDALAALREVYQFVLADGLESLGGLFTGLFFLV